MKTIKKLYGINFPMLFIILCLISCKKKEIEKKDFIFQRGPVKRERLEEIRSQKWEINKIYVYNSTNHYTTKYDRIRFEDIKGEMLEFKEKGVFINNEFVGKADYKGEIFTINNLDTLTNRFYLFRLKNDILTLRNDVGYYKHNKLLKSYSIELVLRPLK